jgi:hypothetical protein
MSARSLKRYLKDRDAAFEATDLDWAQRQMPLASRRVVEAGFHKARAATGSASAERRAESLQWLKDHGYGELFQPQQGYGQ